MHLMRNERRDGGDEYDKDSVNLKPLFIRESLGYGTASPPITRDIEDIVVVDLAFLTLGRDNDLEPIDGRDHAVLGEAVTT